MTEHAPYQGGAFQPPPGYPGPARALRIPAWFAMVTLGLIGAEALAGAALQAFLYPMAISAGEPTDAQQAVADFLYEREQGIAALLLVLAGITFVVWLHRARTNLDGPDSWALTWKRGWAIGGWFLPLGNFVIPQMVVTEVDRVSESRADEAEGRPHERHAGVVVAWVVLWSLFLVVSQFGQSALDALDPGPGVLLGTAFGIFETVTAGSAILLVWRVTANQERMRDALVRLRLAPAGDAVAAPPAAAVPGVSAAVLPGAPASVPIRAAAPDPGPALPVAPKPVDATEFPTAPELDLSGAAEPGAAAR